MNVQRYLKVNAHICTQRESINIKHWNTDYVVQAGVSVSVMVSVAVVQLCIGQVNICIYV